MPARRNSGIGRFCTSKPKSHLAVATSELHALQAQNAYGMSLDVIHLRHIHWWLASLHQFLNINGHRQVKISDA